MNIKKTEFKYTWHEAIELLRNDPVHKDLIFNSYLTLNLLENAKRFASGDEFNEVLKIIKNTFPSAKTVMDMPGGNGIATYAFALNGFEVTTVEPDPSNDVGRGAINFVLQESKLVSNVVEAFGENLPFDDFSFDIVYVRQGLHHAADLKKMIKEIYRVLAPNGILIATREHVVDDYDASLNNFLNSQVDHMLYGGENAFTLEDYVSSISQGGLSMLEVIKPFQSNINMFPSNVNNIELKLLNSMAGKVLSLILPSSMVINIGLWYLNGRKSPGRLYSFVAKKD